MSVKVGRGGQVIVGTLSHARPIGNVVATLGAKLGESRQELRNKVTQTDRGEEIAHFPFRLVGQSETPENTLIVVCVVRYSSWCLEKPAL
jgi:hypothetical protein